MKIFITSVCIIFSITSSMSQCRIFDKSDKKGKGAIRTFEKDMGKEKDIEIDVATFYLTMFNESLIGSGHPMHLQLAIAKGTNDDEYYLNSILVNSGKIEFLDKTPFIISFSNGDSIEIYPITSYYHRTHGTSYKKCAFTVYKISTLQLKEIANSEISSFKIYFASKKKYKNSMIDSLGRYYFYKRYSEEKDFKKSQVRAFPKCVEAVLKHSIP